MLAAQTGCETATDAGHVQQPVGDVLVFERNAAEVLATVHVPRADRHAQCDRAHVVHVALYHEPHHIRRHCRITNTTLRFYFSFSTVVGAGERLGNRLSSFYRPFSR